MHIYSPPLADQHFLLEHVLDVKTEFSTWIAGHEAEMLDLDLIDEMLAQAGRFAADEVLPLNTVADRVGCRFDNGAVTTPPGFREAYRQLRELGWLSLSFESEYGGQNLPRVVFAAVQEMFASAGIAFQMVALVNQCAHDCLSRAASEEIRSKWLPQLAEGKVLVTMCMSEPQAGSDLGLLTTKAVAQPDGSYRLSGTKIFASGAEHDLTDNILHLVLARIVGAPPGTRGLSLFVVPRLQDNGAPNGVQCLGIEHKLGIHGSPTCVMQFDEARGEIVGMPERGLGAMFHMMNAARLGTGLQAVGVGEAAWQQSHAYATERRQGRVPRANAPTQPNATAGAAAAIGADPIIGHADVERMLEIQRAYVEGGRAVTLYTALLIDRAARHADKNVRDKAADAVSWLTPVAKGFLSENAQICTSHALQIHGGHGFITETGIDQYVRDARILSIYEGTTGIQATDLLVRKILQSDDKALAMFVEDLDAAVPSGADARVQRFVEAQRSASRRLLAVTGVIRQRQADDPQLPYRVATSYLRLFGHVVMAALWARSAAAAGHLPPEARAAKLRTAGVYFGQLLPEIETVLAIIEGSVSEVL